MINPNVKGVDVEVLCKEKKTKDKKKKSLWDSLSVNDQLWSSIFIWNNILSTVRKIANKEEDIDQKQQQQQQQQKEKR